MQSEAMKRMKHISIAWGFILCSLVLALTAYGFYYKNQTKKYKEFEIVLEEKSEEYINNKGIVIDDSYKITGEDLIDEGLIESISVESHECEGYVIVSEKDNYQEYSAYIKCGNYKTKGYEN